MSDGSRRQGPILSNRIGPHVIASKSGAPKRPSHVPASNSPNTHGIASHLQAQLRWTILPCLHYLFGIKSPTAKKAIIAQQPELDACHLRANVGHTNAFPSRHSNSWNRSTRHCPGDPEFLPVATVRHLNKHNASKRPHPEKYCEAVARGSYRRPRR